MRLPGQFFGQDEVDPPVPVHWRLSRKLRHHHSHLEMRLRSGRDVVHVAFILHVEGGWR